MVPSSVLVMWQVPALALLCRPVSLARSAAVPPKNPPEPKGSRPESAVERLPLAQT